MKQKGQPQFEQLKMFMSPKEIMGQYQPLDADRESVEGDREGEYTQRSHTTGGMTNLPITTNMRHANWFKDHGVRQGMSPAQVQSMTHLHRGGGPETDEQLWERKLDESEYMSAGKHASHDMESLADSIERGGVHHPVHLGQEIGTSGKPQIVGGHHRIAAQSAIDADRLMPVLHHKNFWAARAGKDYT